MSLIVKDNIRDNNTQRKNYKKFISITILFTLILVFVGISLYKIYFEKHYWQGENNKRFTIEKGETLDKIAQRLEQENIIDNSLKFKIAIMLKMESNNIIAKDYFLPNGMSNDELINFLTDKNKSLNIKFTVIEGITIKQISKLVEEKLNLSAEKFILETQNDSLIKLIGLEGKIKNLEGFLFPNTYFISPGITEKNIVELMFNEFRKKIVNDSAIQNKLSSDSSLNLLKIVTMASIVEGETPNDSEKPTVAGVYYNRLISNMKLDADPTIQYILPNGPKQRLLYSDLEIDSPYNTYKNPGLPPGPINNPGLASIKAAIFYEKHKYLFFVADGTGKHIFTENYIDHQKAVQKYRKLMKEKK